MIVICSNKTDAQTKTVQPHFGSANRILAQQTQRLESGFPHLQNAHVIAFCTIGPAGSALFGSA
jgi:hypothetical protein